MEKVKIPPCTFVPVGVHTAQRLQQAGTGFDEPSTQWHTPKHNPQRPKGRHGPTVPALSSASGSLSKKPPETNICCSQASRAVGNRELQTQPSPCMAFTASQHSQIPPLPPEIFFPALPCTNKQSFFSWYNQSCSTGYGNSLLTLVLCSPRSNKTIRGP